MNKLVQVTIILLVASLFATACGNASTPTPAPEPTATVMPAPTEIPFGCYEDEPYLWADDDPNAVDVAVPYGQTVNYHYSWSGLDWIARLNCDGSRGLSYGIESDFPVTPKGPRAEFSCGNSDWIVVGQEIVEQVCDKSLIFGDEVVVVPQASIIVEKDGRQMAIDLSFEIEDVETVNGPATYLSYHVWWGFLDTGEWAGYKCEGTPQLGFMAQGLGSQLIDDPLVTSFAAVCGGEGMVISMATSR